MRAHTQKSESVLNAEVGSKAPVDTPPPDRTELAPALTPASQGRPDHLPALNGARGLAVLLVLLDHASDNGLMFHPALDFNRAGRHGVLLFFSLSAFLLTYLFFAQPHANLRSTRHWLNYVVRRFFRIYPLFFLALLAWALIRGNFGMGDLVNHLLLTDGQQHFWTIGVEVKYYAILPAIVLIYPVLWHYKRWLSVLAGLAMAAFLRFGLKPLEAAWSTNNDIWLNEFLEVFLLGSISGWLYAQTVRRSIDLARFKWVLETCAWVCMGIAMMRIPAFYNALFNAGPDVSRLPNTSDVFATLWALFLFSTLRGAGGMAKVLSVAPLQNLGRISYSAYLWHPFLLPYVDELSFAPWITLLLFLSATILLATVSYFLIERPLSRIRVA